MSAEKAQYTRATRKLGRRSLASAEEAQSRTRLLAENASLRRRVDGPQGDRVAGVQEDRTRAPKRAAKNDNVNATEKLVDATALINVLRARVRSVVVVNVDSNTEAEEVMSDGVAISSPAKRERTSRASGAATAEEQAKRVNVKKEERDDERDERNIAYEFIERKKNHIEKLEGQIRKLGAVPVPE